MAGRIQNEDVKSLSELTGAGGTSSQLINDTKIYVTANSLNKQLSAAITAGDILSGVASIAQGGTGQTTAGPAFNALSPITTLGDLIYGSGTNANSRLAGNTTSTVKILTQTGTGSVSAAPSWSATLPTTAITGTSTQVMYIDPSNLMGGDSAFTFNDTSKTLNVTNLTLGNALPVGQGGTGQTTASAAFNALSPITATGDLILGNGINSATNLAIGTSGKVLTSNGATASWQPVSASAGGSNTQVQFNSSGSLAGDSNFIWDNTNKFLGIGGAPSQLLHVSKSQNAATIVLADNVNAGASAQVAYKLSNGTHFAQFGIYGTGASSYGAVTANMGYLYSSSTTGLALMADNASGIIAFATGGNSERMRIDSSGNVGIKQSSPSHLLHITGAGGVNNHLRLDETGSGSTEIRIDNNAPEAGNRNWAIRNRFNMIGGLEISVSTAKGGTSFTPVIYMDSNGRFGIGTVPSTQFHLKETAGDVEARIETSGTNRAARIGLVGTIAGFNSIVSSTSGTEDWRIGNNSSGAGYFAIYTGASAVEAMRFASNGNVGIAKTPTSGHVLDVNSNSVYLPSSTVWISTSDARVKQNIQLADLDICYNVIKNLPLKRYNYDPSIPTFAGETDKTINGWIAQDVELVLPKAITSSEMILKEEIKDANGNIIQAKEVLSDCKGLQSDQILKTMYGALQKTMAMVEELKIELDTLKTKNNLL